MAFVGGYTVFLPGKWDIPTFFFSYTMIGVMPLLFLYWKVIHRTQVSLLPFCFLSSLINHDQWRKAQDVNFFEKERMVVDLYEQTYTAA